MVTTVHNASWAEMREKRLRVQGHHVKLTNREEEPVARKPEPKSVMEFDS
jgi:hypothetical protein